MKNLILVFALLCILASPVFAERQLVDRVVAVVNNDAITQSELDSVLRVIYEDYRLQYQGQEFMIKLNEARQKLLNQLIEDRLVYQEAQARGLTVSQQEIEEQMDGFREKFETPEKMEAALQAEGLSESVLQERVRRQAMIRKLHDREIRAKIVVSPKEVEQYFQDHPEEFSSQDQLRVRSMTIKKSEMARQKGLKDEAAQRVILDLKKRIEEGEGFSDLAREFSQDTRADQGGLSEWLPRGTMIPAIDDVIFALKPGEVSDLVETPMGYHLFRVEERQAGHKRTFEEVRDEIHYRLFRQKADERFREWMNDLKRHAYISIR